MPNTALTPTPSPIQSALASCRTLALGLSLSRIQPVVGTMAGLASLTGAAFSVVQFARPARTGELVATVQAAGSRKSVNDALIEVLTPDNVIVATLTPDASGHAARELAEGTYVVRVSHPRFAADVRRIQVVPRHTVEVRATLRAGSSSPIQRAVNDGVSAVRRALRF